MMTLTKNSNNIMNNKDLRKIIEEKISTFKNKNDNEVSSQLYKLKERLSAEIDSKIDSLIKKQNLIKKSFANRKHLLKYKENFFTNVQFRNLLSAPFIYGMFFPALFLDICLEIYHQICFRLYKIPLVKRKDYIIFDRTHLAYLNIYEKFNCLYCSYFNGLIAYATEIAGRTERYWCPIKHAQRLKQTHSQYTHFVEYLDAESYRENLENIRCFDKK